MSAGLHVESVGVGAPLVLLHGWAMHSGFWGSFVARLARRFRVHAVDLPGHGYSPTIEPYTLDVLLATIAARFAAEAEALTVVGWSLGGLLALRWAQRHAARVQRLVLIATSPRFVAAADWPQAMSVETLRRFGDELRLSYRLTIQRFLSLQVHGSDEGRAALLSLRKHLFARGEPSAPMLLQALDLLAQCDLREAASSIAVPGLIVAGDRDTLAPAAAGRWLATAMPNAQLALIGGAAHLPFLSHPQAVDAALQPFLDKTE